MVNYDRISSKIGHKNWLSCVTHDDGQFASDGGGKSTVYLSAPGKGKSTLLCYSAQMSKYVYGSKNDFVDDLANDRDLSDYKVFLETVIWRVRDFDAFANLIPENWANSFKRVGWNQPIKDFHLWVHEDDVNLVFYCHDYRKQPMPIRNLPPIEFYKDADDLMRHLHWGAINAVVEPQTYRLSYTLIQKLKEKKMDISIDDEREMEKQKKLKDRPRGFKKSTRNVPIAYEMREVAPQYFWFDMIHTAIEANKTKHITFCIDEWDDIAEARSEGDVWKLIDILASDWKTLRKANISAHLSTHQTDYVDWRILKRIDYYIWMKGASVHPNYSMITRQELISNLPIGMFLIENTKISFGKEEFDKIPSSQPHVRIDGLKGQQLRLNKFEADKISGLTKVAA